MQYEPTAYDLGITDEQAEVEQEAARDYSRDQCGRSTARS